MTLLEGIDHATFAVVRGLEKSFRFYAEVPGLRAVSRLDRGAYLEAGEDWIALTAHEETRGGPLPEYTHPAFSVSPAFCGEVKELLGEAGAEAWWENPTEGESFYLLDLDGRTPEIHASGSVRRIEADRRNPPPGWRSCR